MIKTGTINFILIGWLLCIAPPLLAQVPSDLFLLHPNTFKAKDKSFQRFYDRSEMQLTKGNDTLDIIIMGNTKLSYRWHDVSRQKGFKGWFGFERDIEKFLEGVKKLKVDTDSNNYFFVFSPETDEIKVSLNPVSRFSKIGEELLPTIRHQITFSYFSYLMEVDFFLGELDELLVIKEAELNRLVLELGEENNWFTDYRKRNFNKAIKINEEGSISLETFKNRENPFYPRFNFELGAGLIGSNFPLIFQPRYNIKLRTKKEHSFNYTLYFAVKGLLFQQTNDEGKLQVGQDYFLGAGVDSDIYGNKASFLYGYRIFGFNGFLEDNRLMTKVDYAVIPQLKIFWSGFFATPIHGENRMLHLVGLTYLIY